MAREYLGSISAGKMNYKLAPTMEVSGAPHCTWSDILPTRAARGGIERLPAGLRDWMKWWLGFPPPRFSEFRGAPLPEAMTGPGDDTWMGWFACCCDRKDGRVSVDFPRTPLHAFGAAVLQYLSRPVSYDPLAKVYSRTPTSARALFKQRLRWNSSRMQDLLRHGPSLLYHWKAGVPLFAGTIVVFVAITLFAAALFAAGPLATFGAVRVPAPAPAFAVLAILGYYTTRLTGTVAGLLISDSPPAMDQARGAPSSVPYHVVFNTLTLLIGYYRDVFGFGSRRRSPPSGRCPQQSDPVAFACRLRRALWLAARSAVYGDVPLGSFWLDGGRPGTAQASTDGARGEAAAVFWPGG